MKFLSLLKNKETIFLILIVLISFEFSTYKLTESPPIWFDEGNYIQVAINLFNSGQQELQVAPNHFSHALYLTTGYTVILPISLVFKFFGIDLMQARAIMVCYILALVLISYFFIKQLVGFRFAALSSLLLITFPPLYGHGKNVMGEIPGIFFLILFLFFIFKLEKSKFKNKNCFILSGLAAGLCLATKPIFFLALPAMVIAIFFYRKKIDFNWQHTLVFILSISAPLLIWAKFQFSDLNSFLGMFSFYSNPHELDNRWQIIIMNLSRFFTESTPLYFLALFLAFIASFFIRIKIKASILLAEYITLYFSIILFFAYLTTVGFYRYFLPAQILMLIFFPTAIFIFSQYIKDKINNSKLKQVKMGAWAVLFLFLSINIYGLLFNSWVVNNYTSKKSLILKNYFSNYSSRESLFLYNTPEIIVFLPHKNYYQYVEFTPIVSIGQEQLLKIKEGMPDEIITPRNMPDEKIKDFSLYQIKDEIGGFAIWEKK